MCYIMGASAADKTEGETNGIQVKSCGRRSRLGGQGTYQGELREKLPKVGDDIQNKWAALAREFVADIEGRPHEPYLTFYDGWRYQVAIEAIRESKGWTRLPE